MATWKHLEIPHAKVYTTELFDEKNAGRLFLALVITTDWQQEYHNFSGRQVAFPRLTAWYSSKAYTYSGTTHPPSKFPEMVLEVKKMVEEACKREFNSVLLNFYRTGRDSVGFHSDDEPELGNKPVIASLSLGEARPLHMQNKKTQQVWLVPQPSGTLVVMGGETQNNYKHSIVKTKDNIGPRINMTFRQNKN